MWLILYVLHGFLDSNFQLQLSGVCDSVLWDLWDYISKVLFTSKKMQMQSACWYLGTVVYGDTQVSNKTPVTQQNAGCYSHNFYPVDPWMIHG